MMTVAIDDLEIQLLLEGVFQYYGIDFRHYAPEFLKRRVLNRVQAENLRTVSGLLEKVLHDPGYMDRFVGDLVLEVTEMFRNPRFWMTFREKVVPFLRTFPFIRIWHAGCSTGEEVYSMAILMQEEGLYERCRFYATGLNGEAVRSAASGIFPLSAMQTYTKNYVEAGGKGAFSDFYTARYDHAVFRAGLKENMVFCQHNLATDGSFNEFQAILCRNVLIYFGRQLQARVLDMFSASLCRSGVLCLGERESLTLANRDDGYERVKCTETIYRKRGCLRHPQSVGSENG